MAKTQTALERAIDTQRIRKMEMDRYDIYHGSAADLIAAGLVRADQFPPEGKRAICYLNGKVIRGNHKYDETYLRIDRWRDRDGTARVEIGVPVDVARARKAAAAAERVARNEAYLRQERAAALAAKAPEIEAIKRELREMPRCADDFRLEFVNHQRRLLNGALKVVPMHGYSFSDEAKDAIRLSLDALVEAVLQADIKFEANVHQAIEQGHRARLAALDPGFKESLQRLVMSNSCIREGVAS